MQSLQRISEYILDELIGAGASGEVWRAHHHLWPDRVVAVKVLTNPNHIQALQRHELTARKLNHPGIATITGFDPYSDPSYIVVEHVPGTSLRPWIESRSISPKAAVQVMTHMLRALVHAHAHGVVHGDLKPENVLVHERATVNGFHNQGLIKLTDFGLSRREVDANSIVLSTSITSFGQKAVGTIDYMSPEQRHGEEVDARSDVYSAGVVFYELLTGTKPVGMESPSELNPHAPIYLDKIFRKAYARLETRYQSAQEFLDALEDRKPGEWSPPLYEAKTRNLEADLARDLGLDPNDAITVQATITPSFEEHSWLGQDRIEIRDDDDQLLDYSPKDEEDVAVLIEDTTPPSTPIRPMSISRPPALIKPHREASDDPLQLLAQETSNHSRVSRPARQPIEQQSWRSAHTIAWVAIGMIVGLLYALVQNRMEQVPISMGIGGILGKMIALKLQAGSNRK